MANNPQLDHRSMLRPTAKRPRKPRPDEIDASLDLAESLKTKLADQSYVASQVTSATGGFLCFALGVKWVGCRPQG